MSPRHEYRNQQRKIILGVHYSFKFNPASPLFIFFYILSGNKKLGGYKTLKNAHRPVEKIKLRTQARTFPLFSHPSVDRYAVGTLWSSASVLWTFEDFNRTNGLWATLYFTLAVLLELAFPQLTQWNSLDISLKQLVFLSYCAILTLVCLYLDLNLHVRYQWMTDITFAVTLEEYIYIFFCSKFNTMQEK